MTSLSSLRKPPSTHFDVKLLITPVVVSYSLASANSDAIPTHAPMSITSRAMAGPRPLSATPTKCTHTDPGVKVRHDGGERDDEQLQRLPSRAPVLRVLRRVVRLRPQYRLPVVRGLQPAREDVAEFDAGLPVSGNE